jgi:feruloyl esterase
MRFGTIAGRLVAGCVGLAGALYAMPALAALSCNVAAIQSAAPADTTITSAVPTATPVPHCKVDGYVTTTNPGPNQDLFRLQLPDQGWTGRYYFIGMGGSAGYVPTDSQIPGGNPLVKGFAVAGTDTGREGSGGDWEFIGQSAAKALDHEHRGAHVVAVATQQITKAYYGVSKIYRYHSGCSGGGRMGMMAIINHPEDFDGVLLGAPGGRSSGTMLKFIQMGQQMAREPGAWISPAKLAMVDKAVTDACDMTDGAKDGVVWDHRLCHFDVATLHCPAGQDGPDCLTTPELKSMKAILDGPRGPDGKLIAEPMPITNVSSWTIFSGATPPPWDLHPDMAHMMQESTGYVMAASLARGFFGPDYDPKNFDFNNQKDIDAWWAAAERTGFGSPYSSDLTGFQKAGGKVLFWNGRSDPCCSDVEMEDYYLEAAGKVGGMSALRKFAALYQVPGMGHCGGGTGPQDAPDVLLDQLVNWVEKGQQPEPVVAHRGTDRIHLAFADPKTGTVSGVLVPPPSGESRDFLLCRYPQYAVFNKAMADKPGAVDDAANWSCHTPQPGEARQG